MLQCYLTIANKNVTVFVIWKPIEGTEICPYIYNKIFFPTDSLILSGLILRTVSTISLDILLIFHAFP